MRHGHYRQKLSDPRGECVMDTIDRNGVTPEENASHFLSELQCVITRSLCHKIWKNIVRTSLLI